MPLCLTGPPAAMATLWRMRAVSPHREPPPFLRPGHCRGTRPARAREKKGAGDEGRGRGPALCRYRAWWATGHPRKGAARAAQPVGALQTLVHSWAWVLDGGFVVCNDLEHRFTFG
jgi:hypothetical protein